MRALVVGCGSVGQRHLAILSKLGLEMSTVSRHGGGDRNFSTLEEALNLSRPDYVVISNETSEHKGAVGKLFSLGFQGKTLVEKPLFDNSIDVPTWSAKKPVFIGYNLRFHRGLVALKEKLVEEEPLSVNCYVGQHLSRWRRARPYASSYSAKRELGGGVLRDLSHELDYLRWIFGPAKAVGASVKKLSQLEIDSEDSCQVLLSTDRGVSVSLEMNYLDWITQRYLTVNSRRQSFRLDFVQGKLQAGAEVHEYPNAAEDSYQAQHEAILAGDYRRLCTYEEGLETVRFIERIEALSSKGDS